MTASVTQFKLVYTPQDRNGADERTRVKFPETRNCLGTFCSFATLFKMHQRDAPNLAYLVAAVGDIHGQTDYYDGIAALRHLSERFTDLLKPDLSAKSVTFFSYVETRDGKHHFRQVAHVLNHRALRELELFKSYGRDTAPSLFSSSCVAELLQLTPEVATPKAITAMLGLAADLMREEEFSQAVQLYMNVLKCDRYNASTYRDLATIYYTGGNGIKKNWELAKSFATESIRLEPDFYHPYLTLAKIALAEKNIEKAVEHLQNAYERNRTVSEVACLLADQVMQKDAQKAKKLVASVVKREPENAKAFSILGKIALIEKRKSDAFDHFSKAYALSGDIEATLFLAEFWIQSEHPYLPRARELITQVLNKESNNVQALALQLELQSL